MRGFDDGDDENDGDSTLMEAVTFCCIALEFRSTSATRLFHQQSTSRGARNISINVDYWGGVVSLKDVKHFVQLTFRRTPKFCSQQPPLTIIYILTRTS